MAIGTGLAIAGLASLAGNAIGAKLKSNAAKKASAAQQQASQQSSNFLQQGIGQLGGLYAPYMNAGAGAMGTLGRLTTPGAGARYASPGPPNAMPPGMGGPMPPPNQAMPRGPMPGGQMPGGTFAQMGPPPGMPPQGRMPPPGAFGY